MENKKSLLIITTLTISAHLLLFANMKIEEKIDIPAKPTSEISKINLKNVVIKQPEPKVEPIVEPIKKVEMEKPLPKTESKNKIKEVKKKEFHKKEKPKVEKVVEKKVEEVKELKKENILLETSSNEVHKIKDEDPALKEALENEYLSKIRNTIERNKTYPKSAKRLNQMGKVHVCFSISKNGEIKNARLVSKSNFERLDEAALEILTKISKFEPIPEKLNKNSWEITIPIVYQITRS